MMKKWFYEKNTEFVESEINKTFEQVLDMTKDEFRQWVIDMRKLVVDLWDKKNQPPRVGYNENEIADQFRQMSSFPVHEFIVKDELTDEKDVIRNTSIVGNAVNQFFPTMMKTRINYTKDVSKGKSIYDYFAKNELLDTFVTYASRHFRRDSFYHYSNPAKVMDQEKYENLPVCQKASDWINKFEESYRKRNEYDYWLAPVAEDKEYTGYNEKLKDQKYLLLTKDEIEKFGDLIPKRSKANVDYEKSELYQIRAFKLCQKLFPVGLKAFRVSFCQYAVNWPPLSAKYIYERFTEEWKNDETVYVWDPSSGWSGRLLGAMSVKDDRHITYLGNDPNTDHNTSPGKTKYHEVHDFFEKNVRKGGLFPVEHTKLKFWQLGSEVMRNDKDFQKYKGKVSLVFTSPPYFSKEKYSEDEEQSCIKFDEYESWREEFLRPTLKTAVEWLRPGGYVAWNIADAVFDGERLPLEKDSCDILKEYGMEYLYTLKLALAQMPGGNRLDKETGLPKTKNFCKVSGMWLKYEPIFIFKKPK